MVLTATVVFLIHILINVNCAPFIPAELGVLGFGVIDYYWREYKGKIPIDAFPGGVDKEGNPTYIGQMYMQGYGLLPATIVTGSNFAVASSQGIAIQTDKDIKILCSVEQHKFKWIKTKIGEEHLFTDDCPLVNGGSEANQIIDIGRASHEGETIIGRVFRHWEIYKGLWIPSKGKQVHFTSYEILTFDCKKYYIENDFEK